MCFQSLRLLPWLSHLAFTASLGTFAADPASSHALVLAVFLVNVVNVVRPVEPTLGVRRLAADHGGRGSIAAAPGRLLLLLLLLVEVMMFASRGRRGR